MKAARKGIVSAFVAAATLMFGSPAFAVHHPGGCTCVPGGPDYPECEGELDMHVAKGTVIVDEDGDVWICDMETHECTLTDIRVPVQG